MKFSLLLGLILASSCGRIENLKGVGEIKDAKAYQISTSDHLIFDSICSSLTKKSQKLSAANPGVMTFDVLEKDCKGETVTSGPQQVRIEANLSGGYQFRRQDTNGLFVFSEVETQNNGFMQSICGGSATQMPIVSGDEAIWISTGAGSRDCPPAGNEECLLLEKGTKTDGGYRILSREFIRINTQNNSGKQGYFTYRRSVAQGNCDKGDSKESSVTLR